MSVFDGARARTLVCHSEAIPTHLGDPLLHPVRLQGTEDLNSLFEYQLYLKTPDGLSPGVALDAAANLDLDAFIGREITCSIELDGAGEFLPGAVGTSVDRIGAGVREISGLITDAQLWGEEGRRVQYKLTIRPWLHLATLSTDCKIFQNQSVVETLDELLADYPFPVEKRLIETYPKRDYGTQYNETDFEFFERLCQEWGISYFFEHSAGSHRLILIDSMGAYRAMPSAAYQKVEFHPPNWKIAYYADIHEHTQLHEPDDGAKPKGPNGPKLTNKKKLHGPFCAEPSLSSKRVLFDFNEHFIEMSNPGEELRSLTFMLLALAGLLVGVPLYFTLLVLLDKRPHSDDWLVGTLLVSGILLVAVMGAYVAWRTIFRAVYFTALCPRYRFNRTTGKVYVLRPKKFGGNAVLDWSRVKAHVHWAPPKSWTAEELEQSGLARHERLESRSEGEGALVLYWPPLDPADPERKGEDVLWVGPTGSGEELWQYIRTFMAHGMHAVPAPGPDNWLRKGFSDAVEHLEEGPMHSSHQRDALLGNETSGMTALSYAAHSPWSPLHSIAERLCYWPKFPEEWNSDCGQRRRESGIGPEEPLRWVAR